jgi:multiple sugar transport system permease protein
MTRAQKFGAVIVHGLLALWLIYSILPFLWTLSTSLKQVVDAFSIPPKLLFTPTTEAYELLWVRERFPEYLLNSVIVAGATVLISISVGCLAAYGLARYTGVSGFVILIVALLFRSLPRMTFALPYFIFGQMTGLYDTRVLLVLVLVAVNQPFTIWMLRSFFMDIPKELEEAAMVDGCSRLGAFLRVIMPLMGPGIITAGIFSVLLAYNEYLIAAMVTATQTRTLPVVIAQFGVAEDLQYWTVSAAASVSVALPIVLLVLFAQKYIVRGLTFGAVKG